MKRAKFGPPLRRALALGAGAAVLCGLYAGAKNLSLPRLWSEDVLDTLAGALVAQETAGFEAEGDEQSIWDALVSSELPADGADEPADTAPDPQRPSLVLRRAGGESLWDMAKKSGSTVAAIRSANKLTEEPKPGQILLIPVC